MLLRLALSSALTADDAREAVLAQSLQWGYQARQPPLYNWLAWGAFRLLGPGLLALTLLKYAVLVLAFWLVYLTGRRILTDPRLATLGAFSFLLIVPISWTIHEALTHSVTVLAACAGTVYALVRLEDAPESRARTRRSASPSGSGSSRSSPTSSSSPRSVLAALSVDRYRARLLSPAILITGARRDWLLVAPVRALVRGRRATTSAALRARGPDRGRRRWAARGGRGPRATSPASPLSYLAPLGLVLAALLPRGLPAPAAGGTRPAGRPAPRVAPRVDARSPRAAPRSAGGLGFLKARWLIPAFFLAPLYGLWRLERHGVPGEAAGGLRGRAGRSPRSPSSAALSVRVVGASLSPGRTG